MRAPLPGLRELWESYPGFSTCLPSSEGKQGRAEVSSSGNRGGSQVVWDVLPLSPAQVGSSYSLWFFDSETATPNRVPFIDHLTPTQTLKMFLWFSVSEPAHKLVSLTQPPGT